MSDFLKQVISETFKSKKQQKYFYAKANDKTLSKSERNKWKRMASEFSDKTNFKKLPEVAEDEIDEIVDELGNIARSKIPTDYRTKGTTSKETTDQSVMKGHGQTGVYGTHGAQTYSRYWGEADMSKTLGYDATMKQDASKEDAEDYFEKELEMDEPEAKERLAAMGYDPELPDDKVRLVENPKKFMQDYIESVLAKKNIDDDIVKKEGEITEINPIILKQIKSLKSSINSNQITIKDLIKLLKDNE